MHRISALIKEPGKDPRHVHISNSLENLQRIVGGYIETVTLTSDFVIICDEEGRLKGYEPCCEICGVDFVGTIIICDEEGRLKGYEQNCKIFGVDFVGTIIICGVRTGADGEDEFCDMPGEWKMWKQLLPQLWDGEPPRATAEGEE